ncbi:MAG: DUF1329 domain-containing protein [Georgfuchsia sp.]
MKHARWINKASVIFLSLWLAACVSRSPQRVDLYPVKREVPPPILFEASFNCTQSASALQDVICADKALSSLDREMSDAYHANLRLLDLVGRMQLIADQRHWLLARATQCKLPHNRLGAGKPKAGQVSCLGNRYRDRIAELRAWPRPEQRKFTSAIGADKFHPLTAYVEYRLADSRDNTTCTEFGKNFNDAIADRGEVNFTRMPGFTEVAGTHGAAEAGGFKVGLYDAGPYASYQMRATGFDINGKTAVHDRSIGEWVANQPNAGGRFSDISSQTRDYASIDIFRQGQRTFALVNEAWGYYSAAAKGESDYAGVYEIVNGNAQRLCLYTTYLTPPIAGAFDSLPAYKALDAALDTMTGEPPMLEMDERRDEGLLRRETEWNLLNMPLVAIGEIERFGRRAALRQRHDVAFDAIWNWSERNLPSKLHYRRLLPMVQPAYDELLAYYRQGQGLKAEEAALAADLMIMDLIDRGAENLSDFNSEKLPPLAPFAQYTPRYAPAPVPGDLERGRKLTTLHSAVLNRASAAVIDDYVKYEFATPERPHGIGPGGDTALMAAVRSPETVQQLLAAGFDVNAGNEWRKTALMTAAQTNQFDAAQVLLDAGADPNRATACWHAPGAGGFDNAEGAIAGRTALMYAAAGADEPLLRLLLVRGAKVDVRDAADRTACNYLADNELMSDATRTAVKTSLCAPDSKAWMPANSTTARAISEAWSRPCPTRSALEVSPEEARRLGGPVLTLWGAEKAGNEDGTIPEYTGSGVAAPPTWNPAKPGVRPDPYGEQPVFTITAQNAGKYADKLDAMIEIFKKYPDFRMDIYPSHRDFVFPQDMLDNSVRNATSCKATEGELRLEGCYGGVPFPLPETGKQVMWNHLAAYTSRASRGKNAGYLIPSSGSSILIGVTQNIQDFPYYDPNRSGPRPASSVFWRMMFTLVEPARWAGTQMMLLNPLDQIGIGSRIYFYSKGTMGRAKLAPELAHDTPVPWSGDTQTMDDIKIFNGSLDLYDFKLIGKKEKYIAYDNFRMTDPAACPASVILTRNFPNPDCVRWELHRVWVVEATLKPDASHIYRKRVFYWDEDGYVAGQAENYGADGNLRRVVIGASYPYFEVPGGADSASFSLDLKTAAWSIQGVTCAGCGDWPLQEKVNDMIFSPDAMANAGIR